MKDEMGDEMDNNELAQLVYEGVYESVVSCDNVCVP